MRNSVTQESGNFGVRQMVRTYRWLLVAPALFLFWLISQIDRANVSFIIADPNFLKELNMIGRNAELGGLMSSFFFGCGIGIFIWGFLVDRFGPRICAITGTLGWAVTVYLSSWVGSIEQFFLLRFLLGLAEGNQWPVSNALTNRWFPVREHSRMQSFWLAGSMSGAAAAAPVVTALMLASGWRGALVALGILSLVPIPFLYWIRNWPRQQPGLSRKEVLEIEQGQKKTSGITPLSFRDLLRSTSFWLIVVTQIISATTAFTMINWLPSFLTSVRHVSFRSMGNLLFFGYLMAAVLTFVVGYIADRTMKRALTGAWVCVVFVVIVLPAAQLLPPVASGLLLASLIAAGSSTGALNGALMHTLVRPEAIARGTGVYVGIGFFLSGFGPAIFGGLISSLQGQYWGGFLFLALMNAVCATCYFALHRMSSRAIPVAPSSTAGQSAASSGS